MIRRIWQRNPGMSVAFLLAVAASAFFAWRAVDTALVLANRADKPAAGWMTPRYIASTYGLDRDDLAAALDTTERDDARQPLYSLAQEQDVPVEVLIESVQALIDAQDGTP
jgi:hypothetical protein